jgi:hypothetical protein
MADMHRTARVVGLLFILASATSVASFFFFESVYDDDYLTTVSTNEHGILVAVLLMFVATASIIGIPIAIYPVMKRYDESWALGYLGARVFEGLFFIFNIVTLLSILSLSREFVAAATPNLAYFETTGALLLAQFEWNSLLLDIPFAVSAVILNYLLLRSGVVPRWLSIWGLAGGILWMPGALIMMFDLMDATFLAVPIGIQEMALAVWLIVKGFNPPADTQ